MDAAFAAALSQFYNAAQSLSNGMTPMRRTIIFSVLFCVLMLGFSFALIPLYNVFCKVTGINGKIDLKDNGVRARYKSDQPVSNRLITVEFDVNRNAQVPCSIVPKHSALQVQPGVLTHTSYQVTNLSNQTLVIQAIPSISPGKVAKYLKKLECFCFNQQILPPNASVELPLRFWLEPEFPDKVHRMTLSYTVFEIKEPARAQ